MNEQDKGITGGLISEILAAVKLNNNITDASEDELLTLYIKAMCTNILVKTNRRIFPPDLKYVVMDLVSDKFDTKKANDNDDSLNSIQSMSEAGRSVNFGTSDIIKAKLNLIAEKQLDDNEKLINKFKLLYKT